MPLIFTESWKENCLNYTFLIPLKSVDCRREKFALSSQFVCSQIPWRSRRIIVLPQGFVFFFARTPFRIQRIIKIYDIMDRFLRKPFWFFESIYSILDFMRLHKLWI